MAVKKSGQFVDCEAKTAERSFFGTTSSVLRSKNGIFTHLSCNAHTSHVFLTRLSHLKYLNYHHGYRLSQLHSTTMNYPQISQIISLMYFDIAETMAH